MELFLSHASSDGELVDDIGKRLAPHDVIVYAAEHDHRAGESLSAKVREAIDRSDMVVVLLTEAGCTSGYVREEIGYALGVGKLVIPIVTSQLGTSALHMLAGVEYIPFDEDDPAAALHALSERIEELSRQAAQARELALVEIARQAVEEAAAQRRIALDAQRREDMAVAALALVCVGVILIAMNS